MGVTSLCSPIRSFLSAQPTPHPSRVPMKCIGIAGHPLPKGEGGDPAGAGEPGEGCLAIPSDLAGTPHQVFAPLVQRDRFWYIYKLSA